MRTKVNPNFIIAMVVLVVALLSVVEISEFVHASHSVRYLNPESFFNFSPHDVPPDRLQTK